MASYSNYVKSENKTTRKDKYNVLNRTKSVKKKEFNNRDERLKKGFKKWTSFFRANPHRFATDYLGLKLHLFQKILIYLAYKVDFFMYLASRGQGKSWIVAVIAVIRCILYPGSKILIASGTRGQARLIVSKKIKNELMLNSPNIAREIFDVKDSMNECVVYFHNGSTIEAVTSSDTARGYRGNILILEEFRLIDRDILIKVLRPFLNVNRQPGFLSKPEYAHLTEENKELYISSCWYKSHWIWNSFKAFKTAMVAGRDYFVCALPYTLSMYHGLLSGKRVEQLRTEDDFDPIAWLMEMKSMFFGESENAFFKLDDMQKCRSIVKPFYPSENANFLDDKHKNKKKKSEKQEGEIRIIGVDVAMMGGNENDLTVFTHMRCLPYNNGFIKQVPYIESLSGVHSETQGIRLKQLFYDFEADFVAMDTNGNGLGLYDAVSKVQYDEDRDVEYMAWVAMNDEKMKNRTLSNSAVPCIYSIKQQNQQVNHEVAVKLRDTFQKRKIKLLVNEIEGREFLANKKLLPKSPEDHALTLRPFIQTTALINEMVNLEYETRNGFIKIKETNGNRKDRYSSLGYANYYASMLENSLYNNDDYDEDDPLVYWL